MIRVFAVLVFSLTATAAETPRSLRIVSLNPALTETLFALGAGSLIVGTSEFSNYPEEAKEIPRIGAYGKPNLEKVIALKPALVVTFREGHDNTSSMMKRTGIQWKAFEARRAESYPNLVRELGALIGRRAEAETLAKSWGTAWKKSFRPPQPKLVLLQLQLSPSIFAGGDTFLSESLIRCGHRNAAAHHSGYPVLSRETLVKLAPEAVLVLSEPHPGLDREAEKKWGALPLKTRPRVIVHDPAVVSILGPRLPSAADEVCRLLELK